MKKLMISVAMTTFNGESFLEEQLKSIFSQTLQPDEVVVVDDGSKDDTISILEKYSRNHKLKYYVNDTHLGVNKNFEKAIRLTSGNVVFISDQDDVWLEKKISVMVEMANNLGINNPIAISSKHYDVDENLVIQKYYDRQLKLNSCSPEDTIFFHNSQGSSMLITRNLIEHMPEFPQDIMYDRFIGLFAVSYGIKYNLSTRLMYYRHHSSNVTSIVRKKKLTLKDIISSYLRNGMIPYGVYMEAHMFVKNYEKYIVNDESRRCFNLLEHYFTSGVISRIKIFCGLKSLCIRYKILGFLAQIITRFVPSTCTMKKDCR